MMKGGVRVRAKANVEYLETGKRSKPKKKAEKDVKTKLEMANGVKGRERGRKRERERRKSLLSFSLVKHPCPRSLYILRYR